MKRFEEMKTQLIQNTLYKSNAQTVWICMKCGNVEYGDTPPEKCPVCEHEGTYYKKASSDEIKIIK